MASSIRQCCPWGSGRRLSVTLHLEGMNLALTQIQLPLMALPVINSLLRLDGNRTRVAERARRKPRGIFVTVILPHDVAGRHRRLAACSLLRLRPPSSPRHWSAADASS